MTDATDRLTQVAALDEIVGAGRLIVSPEQAEKWADAFGLTATQIGIKPRRMDTFHRATYDDPEQTGVAVYDVAISIADALGCPKSGSPYATPYSGTGRNAALWTRRAVNRIRAHRANLPPLDEHEG